MEQPSKLVYELAEVNCNTSPHVNLDGSITTIFNVQISVFGTDPSNLDARYTLPSISMAADDALRLPAALVAAIRKLLPNEYRTALEQLEGERH